jgi:hypothetical protein
LKIPRDKQGENQYLVGRDVKKSVEEDGKRNKHNCVTRGAIPTTMYIGGM